MRIRFIVILFAFSAAVQATSTLRVGNQVLTAGDSRERVTKLLGKPSSKSHKHGSHSPKGRRGGVRVVSNDQGGEQWRYRRGDHVTVVTLVDGRVSDIEDHRL
ncbi:DUF2845 domain-containing protein [Rhodanobacter glycinis]|uniref:DUF2845 domain-containing protein n=1 Tax=Rhodanobacter glycinis TaxID=582702 RepID=A0A502FDM8_9GAMM|nr:DUF2845 domain-containing protein [Rhodanobacter glycinis]TPG11631.1 DUF2845 domain-containing protein [Rhodanobacter glycinis]TPG47517.1 DUF2845 domain-containing protein [Rhodanobacter glycinis]